MHWLIFWFVLELGVATFFQVLIWYIVELDDCRLSILHFQHMLGSCVIRGQSESDSRQGRIYTSIGLWDMSKV